MCAVKTDGEVEYVLYGAESQAKIHYAMPVRNNLYDALEYAGQVEAVSRAHKREMEQEKKGNELKERIAVKLQKQLRKSLALVNF